ncbi:MAG: class I adenylate-forming enzyme family protein [Cyanobacteriota bacterium]
MQLKEIIFNSLKNLNEYFISDDKIKISFYDLYLYVFKESEILKKQIGENNRIIIFSNNNIDFIKNLLVIIYSNNFPIVTNSKYSNEKIIEIVKKFKINFITDSFYNIISTNINHKNTDKNCFIALFTSGSTGDEKIVVLSEEAIFNNTNSVIKNMNLTNPENIAIILPLYHSFALITQLFTSLITGANIFLKDNSCFYGELIEFIKNKNINTIAGVPTTFKTILLDKGNIFNSVKHITVAGAALEIDFSKQLKEFFPNAQIWVGYGLTEAGPRVTAIEYNDINFLKGSVGKSIDDVEIKISLDGEVLVKSLSTMNFYLDNKKDTKNKIKLDYLHTGDTGYIDKDGYLYIIGRKDDIFMSGGEKIAPLMIENVLNSYEKIDMAIVYPEDDIILGKKPVAILKLKNDNITTKEIYNYCLKYLDKSITPRIFYKTDEIPLTHNGKIKRNNINLCKKTKI